MENEEWRPCVYNGVLYDNYLVSDSGRVKSISTYRSNMTGRIKRPQKHSSGYLRLMLSRKSLTTNAYVHRMVAEAFIGPIGHGLNINHKDGIKGNNTLDNLEIVTYSENMLHAIHVIRTNGSLGARHHMAKLTDADVLQIRRMSEEGTPLRDIAEAFGVCKLNVRSIVLRKTWRHI